MKFKKSMKYGILTDSDMKQTKYKLLYAFMFFIMVIVFLSNFLPVLWVILSGFKEPAEMYKVPTTFFPEKIDLSKLWKVWNEMEFYNTYIATFAMSIGSVVFDVVICGFAGYSLSRLKPPGTKAILAILFWVMLMPGTMRTVPLYMIFKDFPLLHINMLNTFWPIWLMAAANIFNIILFKNFFDGISKSLIEAAKIDGATDIGIFFKIVVPLSVPVIMTVSLFGFNGSMGQFFWPYLLIGDKNLEVIGVRLFKMGTGNYSADYQMLAFLFAIIPQVTIFAIFQKKIVGGINVGGVKG